jgi:ABC-2 type transport system ATP-binding protein
VNKISLDIQNVSLTQGSTLLAENLNLSVMEKTFITIMGENGAGKTSLFQTLAGVKRPASGRILFDHTELNQKNLSKILQQTSFVGSERENLGPFLTVNNYFHHLKVFYPSWDMNIQQRLIEKFQLIPTKQISTLSLGESTKLRLVRALSIRPKLLILDELSANLSPASRPELYRVIIELMEEIKMSVLSFSHGVEESVRLSDEILEMGPQGFKTFQQGEAK